MRTFVQTNSLFAFMKRDFSKGTSLAMVAGMYGVAIGIGWLLLAPFAMTSLFLFISIPMMERRQLSTKPAYAEYRKKTRLFI